VKPASFEYTRARTIDEALGGLARDPDAKLLAGGQSLVPLMNLRLARPSRLIDINPVAGLASIAAAPDGRLVIGALTRHSELVTSALIRERAPLLAAAATHVGHRAIRNRGTLGGSLAHADPAAELPAAVLALAATLVVAGPGGRRRIAADDFFLGPFATALAAHEILTEIEVPSQRGGPWGFAEVARRAGDFAIAGVCGVLEREGLSPAAPRLVAFGADDRPIRLTAAETLLASAAGLTPEVTAAAALAATRGVGPADDVHASADYRRHLIGVLTERVLGEAGRRRPGAAAGAR
jgi:carbon-monoxide dehydrogenase medium subunit